MEAAAVIIITFKKYAQFSRILSILCITKLLKIMIDSIQNLGTYINTRVVYTFNIVNIFFWFFNLAKKIKLSFTGK